MQYVSPITILHTDDEPFNTGLSRRDLMLAKRALMAEAELNENKRVIRNGVELSKEDIVTMFDRLAAEANLEFHAKIFADKALLAFLENAECTSESPPFSAELSENEAYRNFVKPYFLHSFEFAVTNGFRQRDFEMIGYLVQTLTLFIASETELIIQLAPIETRLSDLKIYADELGDAIVEIGRWDEDELDMLFSKGLIDLLNLLPFTFQELRNGYMICLINLTVAIYNHGSKGLAKGYARAGLTLECDESYRQEMVKRLEHYISPPLRNTSTAAETQTANDNSGKSYWWVGFVIIAVLRIVFAMFDDNNEPYRKPEYHLPVTYDNTGQGEMPQVESFETRYASDYNNHQFLKSLVDMLNAQTWNRPFATPSDTQPAKNVSLGPVRILLEANWNVAAEKGMLADIALPVFCENRTAMDMVLFYQSGNKIQVCHIPSKQTEQLYMTPGPIRFIPMWGIGWKTGQRIQGDLYRNFENKHATIETGWFKFQQGEMPTQRALQYNLLHKNENPAYVFMDLNGTLYNWTIMGDNISYR